MSVLTFTVPPEHDGINVQRFLRQVCGLSWRLVVKLKRVENGITVDGVLRRTIDRLSAGQTVVLQMPADTLRVEPADMPLTIVYEDEHLLIIDKPPHLAVHPSAGKPEPTLAAGVAAYFLQKGETRAFRPLSRLDRNTSGLLPAAKNTHVAYALSRRFQKTYFAIVLGELHGQGTIDQPLRIKEGSCITREVGDGGKPSVTHWEALATDGVISWVKLVPETGRTHQLRAHMAWMGYPLVGDTMYGTDETVMTRHALHCAELRLIHPITEQELVFSSPLPEDMKQVLLAHQLMKGG